VGGEVSCQRLVAKEEEPELPTRFRERGGGMRVRAEGGKVSSFLGGGDLGPRGKRTGSSEEGPERKRRENVSSQKFSSKKPVPQDRRRWCVCEGCSLQTTKKKPGKLCLLPKLLPKETKRQRPQKLQRGRHVLSGGEVNHVGFSRQLLVSAPTKKEGKGGGKWRFSSKRRQWRSGGRLRAVKGDPLQDGWKTVNRGS